MNFFRYWNTLPRAQNFKPEIEFKTLLARNVPVGTYELLPFGANLDLTWDCILPDITLCFPRWGLIDFSLIGELHVLYKS